ncbi:hypothetical protein V8J82_18030 [Gymnodinialimonas sp. 2305UL16-5]|uniref:hypothetical protein n=1 Tax=Gymnodinialimonas mytili TaxID=3126503 RepID=UPI0030A089FC
MIRHIALYAALTLIAVPGIALSETAHGWISSGLGMEVRAVRVAGWHPVGGQLYATDAITLWQAEGPGLTIPDQEAGVTGYIDAETGRTAALALIWSADPVACGEDLASAGIDTGTFAFLTPADAAALDAYADPSMGTYHGTYADQLDATVPTIPFMATLPDGTTFPATGSGWGDGGYPVASLIDAEGDTVALYVQFMGGDEDWLLPPPCAPDPNS